jgi:hypothetical protein
MIRRGLEDSIPRAGRIMRPTVTSLCGSLSADGRRAQGGFGPCSLDERADGGYWQVSRRECQAIGLNCRGGFKQAMQCLWNVKVRQRPRDFPSTLARRVASLKQAAFAEPVLTSRGNAVLSEPRPGRRPRSAAQCEEARTGSSTGD